ncbi:hypothetical protein BG55_01140 [Erwinia mallotivora]|uniref:Uncharacterized protein n=1 Tax=Erwinia mallotivora TaxID=69222 RepID=A0A014Q275_9GAMM|nr:hypothetical protein BG55_01140 [Erwinia mallotivora]
MPGKYKSDSRSFNGSCKIRSQSPTVYSGEATHENAQIYANPPLIATEENKTCADRAIISGKSGEKTK